MDILSVGGLVLEFAGISITKVACALILGIIINIIVHIKDNKNPELNEEKEE